MPGGREQVLSPHPPAAGAVAAGAVAFGAQVATGAAVTAALTTAAITTVGSLALGFVSQALAPEPPEVNRNDFASQGRELTQQIKEPITSRRTVYGEQRVSGPLVYVGSTNDDEQLHYVIPVAGHEIEGFKALFLNDELIWPDQIAANGNVTSGKYDGKVRIRTHIGRADQNADSELRQDIGEWTTDHRLRGVAYIYVRLTADEDLFPSRIPSISAIVQGKKVYDPRDGQTRYSPNLALCVRDCLTDTVYGIGADASTEIDDTTFSADANTCEEIVETKAITQSVNNVSAAANTLGRSGGRWQVQTGDRIRLQSTGSVPSPLSQGTDYYVIVVRHKPGPEGREARIQCAASLADAFAGNAIDLTDTGSGVINIKQTGEPRYMCDGAIRWDTEYGRALQDMLTAGAARLIYVGGKWKIKVGTWRAPTLTFDEGDVVGGISVSTKIPRRERFNSVRGDFAGPENDWQPQTYPARQDTAGVTADGEEIWKDLNLPFTARPSACQRIAEIELRRMRHETTVDTECNLTAFQAEVADNIHLDNDRYGWSGKPFEVQNWAFDVSGEPPVPVVGLRLRETASTVYDWDKGEREQRDPAPDTSLPNPFRVTTPGAPEVTEELYSTRTGGVKARAVLTAQASPKAFVRAYQFRFKRTSASTWAVRPEVSVPDDEIEDIAPDNYDFAVRAINELGVRSDWVSVGPVELQGLAAEPAAITGLTVQSVSSLALLRWDQHTDLDVRQGGIIVFRHSKSQLGATWPNSVSIGGAAAGDVTQTLLPLKPGTYLARAVDSTGNQGPVASVATAGGKVQAFANVATLQADPNFSGTNSSTVADTARSPAALQLAGTGSFDGIADVDAIDNLDAYGGIASSGTYTFGSGADLGSVQNVRLESTVKAVVANVLQRIDNRSTLIDDWDDFDGSGGADGDAQVWVRATDDDPSGSPTWGAWERLDVGEYEARGFEFQARLSSADPAYNVFVEELRVSADQIS